MLQKYGDIKFRAEAVDWPLKTYVDYMNDNWDESPLYLFDRSFVEKMDLSVGRNGHYWPPESFGEDLFAVLGDRRPDSRWLIVGPERSGSTFHKDPNATRSVYHVLVAQTRLLIEIQCLERRHQGLEVLDHVSHLSDSASTTRCVRVGRSKRGHQSSKHCRVAARLPCRGKEDAWLSRGHL
jgi:hypothetical protein